MLGDGAPRVERERWALREATDEQDRVRWREAARMQREIVFQQMTPRL
jgi:hypothetical protein